MSCFAPAVAGPRPVAVPWGPGPGSVQYPNGAAAPMQQPVRAYGGAPLQGIVPGQVQVDGLQAEVARRKAAESRVQELEALVARLQNRVAVLEGKPKGGPRRSVPARKQGVDTQARLHTHDTSMYLLLPGTYLLQYTYLLPTRYADERQFPYPSRVGSKCAKDET
eukprot:s3257_g1.t1